MVLIASLEKELLFDTHQPDLHGIPFPFPKIDRTGGKIESAYAFVLLDNELFAMAATPLLAPDPIAWLCPGFRIDDDFAREIKTYTNLEITFATAPRFLRHLFRGTATDPQWPRCRAWLTLPPRQIVDLTVTGEPFLSFSVPLPSEKGTVLRASATLARPGTRALSSAGTDTFYFLALLGLAISAALGMRIARGVSQAGAGTRGGRTKNRARRLRTSRAGPQEDELGSLAAFLQPMSDGLAERDRVRDLLGKVVSPEVAAELLRKDVVLGGEEREVTVLFSDLRNFTAMSENLSPHETLAILNRYFTRMSGIVEKHGGVVDKYMGDALMALFGARWPIRMTPIGR